MADLDSIASTIFVNITDDSDFVHGAPPRQGMAQDHGHPTAKLGREFNEWFGQAGDLKPDLPKKGLSTLMKKSREARTNASRQGLCSQECRRCRVRMWSGQTAREDPRREQGLCTRCQNHRVPAHQPLRMLAACA